MQEAGWAPGPVWTGAENLVPTGIRPPDRPARSQSLYRLSYRAAPVIRVRVKWRWVKWYGGIPKHSERLLSQCHCPPHELPKERALSSAIWKGLTKKHIKDQFVPHRDTCHLHYRKHPVNSVLGTHHCSSENHTKYTKYTVWLYINKIQRDATVCRYLFTAKLLYMFRVSIAPIIRSTSKLTATSGTGHSVRATTFR